MRRARRWALLLAITPIILNGQVSVTLADGTTAAPAARGGATASANKPATTTRYVGVDESSKVSLTLTESPDGPLWGTLTEGERTMSLALQRKGSAFEGTVDTGDGSLPVTAVLNGEDFVLKFSEGDTMTFRRVKSRH